MLGCRRHQKGPSCQQSESSRRNRPARPLETLQHLTAVMEDQSGDAKPTRRGPSEQDRDRMRSQLHRLHSIPPDERVELLDQAFGAD